MGRTVVKVWLNLSIFWNYENLGHLSSSSRYKRFDKSKCSERTDSLYLTIYLFYLLKTQSNGGCFQTYF